MIRGATGTNSCFQPPARKPSEELVRTQAQGDLFCSLILKLLNPQTAKHSPPTLAFAGGSPLWLPYCGLGPGAAHAPLDLVNHVDTQVGVGRVEPAGLLLLLLLGVMPQGGHRDAVLLKHERCDGGRNLHLAFVFGFLLNKGVAVRVACSVPL